MKKENRTDTELLKEGSKNWSTDDWENHLQSLEGGIEGLQIPPYYYDEICAYLTKSIFDDVANDIPREQKELIFKAIKSLSDTDKIIIEKIFFEGLSEQQVANALGVSKQVINFKKIRALSHLKNNPLVGAVILTRVKGKIKKKPLCPFERIDREFQKGKITKDEKYRLWALHEVGALRRFVK